MTVIGFAVSTTFIVFICARLLCARMQLNAARRSMPLPVLSSFEVPMIRTRMMPKMGAKLRCCEWQRSTRSDSGMQGLEASALAKFPTKRYEDMYAISKNDTESQCTICLAEYEHEDSLRFIPYCGHSFHKNCIDIWLRQHATCPICRTSVRDISEKKQVMQPMFSPPTQPLHIQGSYQMSSYHMC